MSLQADVLIFEDDPEMGSLAETLVRHLGYSCKRFLDGKRALEMAKESTPKLIILDIMMPGMDGLSLCRRLKADAATHAIKVLIASAKPAQVERPRAEQAGADAFIEKPYQVERLQQLIQQMGGAPAKPKTGGLPTLRVMFWGTRGFPDKPMEASTFGSRTSCVSVQAANGATYILDAGTGLPACVQHLEKEGHSGEVGLLLTHYHVDHIQGLQQFGLAQKAGLTIKVGGPEDPQLDLQKLLQQCLPQTAAKLQPSYLYEQAYALSPNVKLDVMYAQHPTTTLAFSLEIDGRKIVYCPDSEIDDTAEVQFGDYEKKLARFCSSADLLIHNAHFIPQDYARAKGSGYSAWPAVLRVAARSAVRRVALFHIAASYPDWRLHEIEKQAVQTRDESRRPIEVFVPKEGNGVMIA
ncbi:MAG: response regulator [Elusimicrobia bacterium]|nr:response regulator [Elusimicrobiota bacterium]